MKHRLLAAAAALALGAALAHAYLPPTPVANLLFRAKDPADLRAQLSAHRDSVAASDSLDAAEAWYWLGASHERAGQRAPALEAYRRSFATRRNDEDALALADLLVRSGRPADAEEALRLLAPLVARAGADRSSASAAIRLRAAWATALAGREPDACRAIVERPADLLAPRQPLPNAGTWAARFAPLLLRNGFVEQGRPLLARALAASRGRDSALAVLARRHGVPVDAPGSRRPALADSLLARTLPGLAVPRVVATRPNGALAAWRPLARAARSTPAPLALLVFDPDAESFATADSLTAQLERAGMAWAIVDPIGVRASVSRRFPQPTAWAGREDECALATARDLAAAIPAIATLAGGDPQRVVLVTEGRMAMAAALAAKADTRIRAVVLASPKPSGAEYGWLVSTLASAQVPVFFQTGPEDVWDNETVDRFAALLPSRLVRVADAQGAGHGLALWRSGPAVGRRLSDWLATMWTSRPSTPRAPRR